MVSANSPLIVLLRDCGELRLFDSIREMQDALEAIDVENDEYKAWDSTATPLQLSVRDSSDWLCLEPSGPSEPGVLADTIRQAAQRLNAELDLSPSLQAGDFVGALRQIAAAAQARYDAQSWWRRLKDRL
jgi:hypothetical protein